MAAAQQPSRAWNITLWIVQILLAATLIWAAAMKLLQPTEKLAAMWPWTSQVPPALVTFTAITDLLGALGLVLPALLRIQPRLIPIAAICIVILMIVASAFHIARGEASLIGVNITFTLMAAFIAWGRIVRAPITSK